VLGTRGRVGASVYSAIERHPAAHALSGALDRHFGQGASRAKRAEHSLAGVRMLCALFADAGFAEVRVETVTRNVHFASVGEYVRVQLTATPLTALLAEHELARSERLIALVSADVSDRLARYVQKAAWTFRRRFTLRWRHLEPSWCRHPGLSNRLRRSARHDLRDRKARRSRRHKMCFCSSYVN
jgi:hypothetical protein